MKVNMCHKKVKAKRREAPDKGYARKVGGIWIDPMSFPNLTK
jgi:hypothetical protein